MAASSDCMRSAMADSVGGSQPSGSDALMPPGAAGAGVPPCPAPSSACASTCSRSGDDHASFRMGGLRVNMGDSRAGTTAASSWPRQRRSSSGVDAAASRSYHCHLLKSYVTAMCGSAAAMVTRSCLSLRMRMQSVSSGCRAGAPSGIWNQYACGCMVPSRCASAMVRPRPMCSARGMTHSGAEGMAALMVSPWRARLAASTASRAPRGSSTPLSASTCPPWVATRQLSPSAPSTNRRPALGSVMMGAPSCAPPSPPSSWPAMAGTRCQ
mmetsp:Transcript_32079/g.81535  ORF Transcript_32079/g.81535 Transcript_32079/m.81535 type:complete len:269 (-) Transcript_32079:22-828(-)